MTLKRIVLGEEAGRKKSTSCMTPFTQNSRKCTLAYSARKQISGSWVTGGIKKGYEESFEGDRYVHYLDCVGFMSIYTSTIIKLYTLNMSIYYMSVFPQ